MKLLITILYSFFALTATDQVAFHENYADKLKSFYLSVFVNKIEKEGELKKSLVEYKKDNELADYKCITGEELASKKGDEKNIEAFKVNKLCKDIVNHDKALDGTLTAYQQTHSIISKMRKDKPVKADSDMVNRPSQVFVIPETITHKDLVETQIQNDARVVSEEEKKIASQSTPDKVETPPIIETKPPVSDPRFEDCGEYFSYCSTGTSWPGSGDHTFSGVTCDDIRVSEGHTWKNRYDYICRGGKVVLLQKKYQYVKGLSCSFDPKTGKVTRPSFFDAPPDRFYEINNDVFRGVNYKDEITTTNFWGCVEGKQVNISDLKFNPIKCEKFGKKIGDFWWERTKETKEQDCTRGFVCGGPQKAKRSKEIAWTCDKYNHVIPAIVYGRERTTREKQSIPPGYKILSMKIDQQQFIQAIRYGNWEGEACMWTNTERFRKPICEGQFDSFASCQGDYKIELTDEQAERMHGDPMLFDPGTFKAKRCFNGSYWFKMNGQANACGTLNLNRTCQTYCRNECFKQVYAPQGIDGEFTNEYKTYYPEERIQRNLYDK